MSATFNIPFRIFVFFFVSILFLSPHHFLLFARSSRTNCAQTERATSLAHRNSSPWIMCIKTIYLQPYSHTRYIYIYVIKGRHGDGMQHDPSNWWTYDLHIFLHLLSPAVPLLSHLSSIKFSVMSIELRRGRKATGPTGTVSSISL